MDDAVQTETKYNLVKTTEELSRAKRDLDAAVENLYRERLTQQETDKKKEELQKSLERLGKLKEVSLTLAFDPSADFISKMWEVLSKSLGTDFVLDISLNKAVIGGVIIEFGGKHVDYSLRRVFEEKTILE